MEKIKVLQVNKLYYPAIGGIERVVQDIAEGLKDQVDMEVLVCQPKGKGTREQVNGVPVERCSSLGTYFSLPISFSFLWKLRKKSREKDILHFHAPFPLGDLACLLSGYQGKVILYWHSDVVKQKRLLRLYAPLMKWFLKRADVIIVAARGNIEGSSFLKPFREKCVLIPYAVNREIEKRGREYLQRAVFKENKGIHFLFVGRLVYYKGVDILLKAFEGLSEGELTIVGSGTMETELRQYAKDHGLEQRVHFLGKVSEDRLYRALEDCDVFVLPSVAKSEAFGLVQMEAMAYGKPVINTALPSGVPEVSLDGITGLTVKPGDPKDLCRAMKKLAEDSELRRRMGEAARKRLEQEYTFDVMMARILKLYQDILKDEQVKE